LLQKKEKQPVNKVFQTYLNVYLPNLLIVEDKISMAHAIESRTPLLDNEMLLLSLSISQNTKLHKGHLKAFIKEIARTLLPDIYFKQPKRGFPTPLREWLRGPLSDAIQLRLLSNDSPLLRIMDENNLRRWVKRYQISWKRKIRPLDEIQSHQIWQLLSLDSWMRGWEKKNGVRLK
jgi:asparagine synthase (glutamine-hydrolysing)